MRWLTIVLLMMGCAACVGPANSQTPSAAATPAWAAPEGWVRYPVPPAGGAALRCANYSTREWRVTAVGENLKVSLDARSNHQDPLPPGLDLKRLAVDAKGERHVIRVEDGWLIGSDAGEFGGGLWWVSSEGRSSKRLAGENVVGFAESWRGVIALTGLAHMGQDDGQALRITEGEAGNRKVEALANLGGAPRAFATEASDSVLIVTTRGLVRLRTSGSVEQLLPTNYGLLYPNSMTLSPSGVIHVGMRHFITRLTPAGDGYQEEWFVPAGCARFRIRDYDCVCLSGRS
jgi:hypothetical protein